MLRVQVEITGDKRGCLPNNLKNYGGTIPQEIRESGIKDIGHWYETQPDKAKEWQAEGGSYRDEDGNFHIPKHMMWACWLRGASGMKVKLGGKSTAIGSIIAGSISIDQAEIVMIDSKNKPITKFDDLVTMMVRVPPRTGSRVPKTWGRITGWSARFTVTAEENVTLDHLAVFHEALKAAGQFHGIFDARPGLRKFDYGKFTVKTWKVENVKGRALGEAAD